MRQRISRVFPFQLRPSPHRKVAYEWHLIDRVPRIRLLPGEQNREFVLSHAAEEAYLSACPQPLRDIALVIMDAGLRTSEVLNLEWRYVHLEPAPGAKYRSEERRVGKECRSRW